MDAYDELLERLKDIDLIGQIGGLMGWDQEVLAHCEGIRWVLFFKHASGFRHRAQFPFRFDDSPSRDPPLHRPERSIWFYTKPDVQCLHSRQDTQGSNQYLRRDRRVTEPTVRQRSRQGRG